MILVLIFRGQVLFEFKITVTVDSINTATSTNLAINSLNYILSNLLRESLVAVFG